MNHEPRLRQVRIDKGPPLYQPPGARRGLREEDEMENGRAVALVLW